jgi:hypothetical protein
MIDSDTARRRPETEARTPDYTRDESRAQQLDRNWAELVQELRVIGTGVQILFAFLLGIAFQARLGQTTSFQQHGRGVLRRLVLLPSLAAPAGPR